MIRLRKSRLGGQGLFAAKSLPQGTTLKCSYSETHANAAAAAGEFDPLQCHCPLGFPVKIPERLYHHPFYKDYTVREHLGKPWRASPKKKKRRRLMIGLTSMMNHQCSSPNCVLREMDTDRVVFRIRIESTVKKDTELVWNYNESGARPEFLNPACCQCSRKSPKVSLPCLCLYSCSSSFLFSCSSYAYAPPTTTVSNANTANAPLQDKIPR
jgi:SET domain